jgi:anti-anti-sigma regulatory factor
MNISVSQAQGRVPVTVLQLDGKLDGQTYQELIDKARELYDSGTRNVLVDMTGLSYISSAGLVSLHTIALLMRGEALPDPEQGWANVKNMDRSREAGVQEHIKLFNPRPEVKSVLDMVGFSQMFGIYTDREQALQSFG